MAVVSSVVTTLASCVHPPFKKDVWLRDLDLNQSHRMQSPACCHYTIPLNSLINGGLSTGTSVMAAIAVIIQRGTNTHQIVRYFIQRAFICQAKIYIIHLVDPFSFDGTAQAAPYAEGSNVLYDP